MASCQQPHHSSFRFTANPFVSVSSVVLVLKELVATDRHQGDECHELLEVALGVAVRVQALHQAVQRGLVFDVLQEREEDGFTATVLMNPNRRRSPTAIRSGSSSCSRSLSSLFFSLCLSPSLSEYFWNTAMMVAMEVSRSVILSCFCLN